MHIQLHPAAEEIIWSVYNNQNTAAKGCHESGKTYIAAGLMHWWLSTHLDSICITTAPNQEAVEKLIWRDYNDQYIQAEAINDFTLYPTKPLLAEHTISPKWFALGKTAKHENAAYFQGFHSRGPMLYIIDEGSGVETTFFDARHRFASKPDDRVLVLGNPYPAGTEFHRCFKGTDYHDITISAFDTPNVKAGRVVIPGMITTEQVEKWRAAYGEESAFWVTRVLAQFYELGDTGLIPLSWWEAAVKKWHDLKDKAHEGKKNLGVDVATEGIDETIFIKIDGCYVHEPEQFSSPDTTTIGNHCERFINAGYSATVDAIGVGSGVVSTIRNNGGHVLAYKGSERTDEKDKSGEFGFANLRSLAYWRLREGLDPRNPDGLALPNDPKLKEDLVGLTYREVAGGKIQIEEKAAVVKRLGRSPDRGDALAMANYGRYRGIFVSQMSDEERAYIANQNEPQDALESIYGA
jgi:phage terminase large subunit